MEKAKTVIYDLHLYKSKLEYLIRFVIWVISWIGSAYVLRKSQNGVGSAYFVLSLSMFMELVPIIANNTKSTLSRILHAVICFLILILCVLSVGMLISSEYGYRCHQVLFWVSLLIIAYMLVDCFLLWVFDLPSDVSRKSDNVADDDAVLEFLKRAIKGNLGDIEVNKNV